MLCSAPEDTLDPPLHQPGFPAYGVAFMVIGGLCIIAAPIVLVVRESSVCWAGRAALALLWGLAEGLCEAR